MSAKLAAWDLSVSRFDARGTLVAFFDLAAFARGTEIYAFLRLAEMARAERGYDSIRLVFVPKGPEVSVGDDDRARSLPFKMSIVSMLMPTVKGYSICSTRDEASAIIRDAGIGVFPDGYEVSPLNDCFTGEVGMSLTIAEKARQLTGRGISFEFFEVPLQARDYVAAWSNCLFGNRPLVAITLADNVGSKEVGGEDEAMTRISTDRLRILEHFNEHESALVFVSNHGIAIDDLPDKYRAIPILPGSTEYSPIRFALYRAARINLVEYPAALGMFVGDCDLRSAYFGDAATDGWGNLEGEVRIIDPDNGDAVRNLIRASEGHLDAGTGGGTHRSSESSTVASVANFFKQAMKIQESGGNLASALRIYTSILRARPNHAGAMGMLGVLYMTAGKYEDAKPLLQSAVTLDDSEPAHHYNLGSLYLSLGLVENAIACFQTVVRIDPEMFDAWGILGSIFHDRADYENAVDSLRRAMLAPKKSTEVIFLLAECFAQLGRYEESAEAYEIAGERFVELLDDEEASNVMSLSFPRVPYSARNATFANE